MHPIQYHACLLTHHNVLFKSVLAFLLILLPRQEKESSFVKLKKPFKKTLSTPLGNCSFFDIFYSHWQIKDIFSIDFAMYLKLRFCIEIQRQFFYIGNLNTFARSSKTLGFPLLIYIGILKAFSLLQNFRISLVILYRDFKYFCQLQNFRIPNVILYRDFKYFCQLQDFRIPLVNLYRDFKVFFPASKLQDYPCYFIQGF